MKTTYQKKRLNEIRSGLSGPLLLWLLLCLLFTGVNNTFAQVDPLEFPPGHPNVTVSATQQLQSFPVPRYKPGHTLLPNYNVMDPIYFGGYKQPGVSDATAIHTQADIQRELAKNFNYMLTLTWFTGAYNDTCVALANANPQYKACLMSLRAQTGGSKMWDQNFSNDHYLQNSSGTFLDWSGNPTAYPYKVWRPTAPAADYSADGDVVRGYLNASLANLTRNVDIVNEDGEVYPILENYALQSDPAVTAAKNASGLGWQPFLAKKVRENDNAYRAKFMSHPRLQNAKYTEYRMDGHRDYQLAWEESRYINDPINGQYYSTPDLYVRWPNNWKDWVSAWHGLKWITQSRYYELALGDKLFSPFVAAGWDANPENDVRPAQWLGLMKVMGMYGSEFYYTSYFTESLPANDPRGYAWQAVIPPYSQAVSSRYEDILRNGSLLAGDMIDNSNYAYGINQPIPYYQFSTGATNKVVVIRKKDTANKYAITGTIQNSSNTINSTPLIDDAQITLNGQTLKFKVRRQGSTYIYDNTNTSAPVFYQLDGWHENAHPWYWSKDFNFEAELYDNTTTAYNIKTTVPAGTSAGDYRSFTSFITFPDAQTSFTPIEYTFTPRVAPTTYYLWVKMRSRVNGATTGVTVSVDNTNTKTISCAADTIWKWYRIDAASQQAISYSNLTLANHTLRLTPENSKLEIDQIIMSTNSNLGLTPAGPTCSTNCTATATANGPTTFCPGGNVVLTASSGSSYLWTPGNQTTQSITVSSAGSYSVTVIQSNGCSATSTPMTVSVSSAATSTITPNGATTFCQGGSVVLSANSGNSYLWTPGGATTQSITASSSGSYTVRVTNAGGCSATSSAVIVTVNSNPTATITPGGATTFCQGGNVTLTSSTGSSYLWLPNNETTQSINVSSSGSYSVRVTNSNGCSSTSAAQNVTVNVPAVPVITPSGSTSIIQGQTVTLTSSAGASYNWTPNGQTTQSITVGTAGSYRVTVTYANGCSAISSATSVTVSNPVTITVNGSSSICEGDSVLLSATAGFSYLWFPGLQTGSSIYVKAAGTYTVQASNGTSAQVVITLNDEPMTPSITTTYIPNAAYQLTAYEPSAVSYLWSNGQTSQTISMTTGGNVSVRAINATGCISNPQSMTVVNPVASPCAKANMLTSYNIDDDEAMVAWNPAITADSFEVSYVRTGMVNYKFITVPGNVSSTRIGGLKPGVHYEWTVKTFCAGTEKKSNPADFTTLSVPLSCGSTPINLTTGNIAQNSATLKWYATSAQQYVVQYRKAGTGAFTTQTVNAQTYPDRTYLSNLLTNTSYEWKVQSVCNGNTTLFSPLAIFTTTDTCTPPGTIYQVDVSYDLAVIGWDPAISVDTFKIFYAGPDDYATETIVGNPNLGHGQISNLMPDTYYAVRVRTVCANGGKSRWSNKLMIHTLPSPVVRMDASDPLHLNAYPNPVKETLKYAFITDKSSEYTLKVTDMSGRQLFQTVRKAVQGLNGDDLNVSKYANGMYMLIVEQGPSVSRFKFSVE